MPDIRTRKRQILNEQLEALWQDYEAAIKQSTSALAAVDQNKAERQAEEIYEKIEKLDNELKSLEIAPAEDTADGSKPDISRIQLELRARLPEKLPAMVSKGFSPIGVKVSAGSGSP